MADDLTSLTEIHEENLISNIKQRYYNNKIYTYIGDILIAVNPYCDLGLYGEEQRHEFTDVRSKQDHQPHIYLVSDRAYQNLKDSGINQCCVVSGESGAGKTESTKFLVEHIAYLCKHDDSDLHEKIIAVNPLLEAFGNAQTVINDNSSRFGKFIELVFGRNGNIVGAKISEYLLEKSRLVNHAPGEKNFHIFYYLFAGLNEDKLSANLLSSPEQHRIMQEVDGGNVYKDDIRRGECKRMWSVLQALMTRVGFKSYDVEGIEAILTAILHISDIKFLPDQETDGVSIINEEQAYQASQLLAVDEENLVNALLLTTNIVNNEKITSLKNETQANDCRDALCKALYGRMFSWIVLQINKLLAPNIDRTYMDELEWIGILDIYGFENFRLNSFEQLCINIANEQLQLFFNQHIFKLELAEYAKEGIDGKDINFVDNQPLLDLFLEPKNPPGLFALLDEETKFPRSTDNSLIDKLNGNLKNHPNYQCTKGQSLNFTIRHFAGPVTYNVSGFLEKNRDTLSVNLIDCLKESESVLVNDLFSPLTEIGGTLYKNMNTANRKNLRMSKMVVAGSKVRKGKISSLDMLKRASKMVYKNEKSVLRSQENYTKDSSVRAAKTLATHFSSSLCELITKMTSAQPHFIRCIKPNAHKMPENFEDEMVLRQLNYSGVLETIEIRKQGFASRIPFDNFVYRYGLIVGLMNGGGAAAKSVCEKVMKHAKLADWRLGKSKIFLKHYHVERLDALYREASGPIIVCQQLWKCALARKKLRDLRTAANLYKLQAEKLSLSFQNNAQKFLSELKTEAEGKTNSSYSEPVKQMSKLAEMTLANDENKKKVEKRKMKGTMSPTLRAAALKELDNMECILENETTKSSGMLAKGKQPNLPPIYRNIKSSSNDPTYVFLHESLGKFNTLTLDIWGKLYFMEKNAIIGKLYVKDNNIMINDSKDNYTGSNIGVNAPAFEHLPNEEVQRTISNIGKGITLARDEQNNVYITKHSDLDVFIYGAHDPDKHCFPQNINKRNSKLSPESTMLFDAEVFRTKVCNELKKTPPNISKIVGLSCFSFSFDKQASRQVDLPVWACFINFSALDTLGKPEVLTKSIEEGLLNDDSYTRNLWKQLDFKRSS